MLCFLLQIEIYGKCQSYMRCSGYCARKNGTHCAAFDRNADVQKICESKPFQKINKYTKSNIYYIYRKTNRRRKVYRSVEKGNHKILFSFISAL